MRIAICDDMAVDREKLKHFMENFFSMHRETEYEIREFESGEKLLFAIEDDVDYTVIFLDIFMGGITGMDTALKLRRSGVKSRLIFLTTTREFAVESYEVAAFGYLVKPFNEQRLCALMEDIMSSLERRRIAVKAKGKRILIDPEELIYIESNDKISTLYFYDGQKIEVREKLSSLEEQLADEAFLRCHQSFLVNMKYIENAEDDFVLKSGMRIPIKVRARKAMSDAYFHWFVNHTAEMLPKEG